MPSFWQSHVCWLSAGTVYLSRSCRVHQTLRVTPAMAAGVTDHVWDIEEIVSLLDITKAEKEAA